MKSPTSIPGFWDSPITPEVLAVAGSRLAFVQSFHDDVFWDETRPSEAGRNVVVSRSHGDILPAPWSAKTRVHEMGGLSWLVTVWNNEPGLLFCESSDQRLYWKTDGGVPQALTPASPEDISWRYCDMLIRGDEVWCIREADKHGQTTRAIIAISSDGTTRILDEQSHFYAHLTLSPDQNCLAWIAWEHPQMPWDGTELFVAAINEQGELSTRKVLAGGLEESVNSPVWDSNSSLYFISDATNWWNLWHVTLDGQRTHVIKDECEWSLPLWIVGWNLLRITSNGKIIGMRGNPESRELVSYDPETQTCTGFSPSVAEISSISLSVSHAYVVAEHADNMPSIVEFDLVTHRQSSVVMQLESPIKVSYFSTPQHLTLPSVNGRVVHAIVHPAHNPDVTSRANPPVIITAHGGPTAESYAAANLKFAFWTSRGFTVVDVNYGGSTGYGRKYRNELRGQWGVVDTEDIIAVAQGLLDNGKVDPGKLFIRGGSAGGFAVLNALTQSTLFSGGADYYGVADLIPLAMDTHDFESRYLDSLIGPFPEARELHVQRSPLTHANKVSAPLIFFQGLDDPIVPPAQSETFRDACITNGLKYKYFEFAGESHGFRQAETIVTCAREELAFYQEILGGELS